MLKRFIIACLIFFLIVASFWAYFRYQSNKNIGFLVLYGNVDVRQVDIGFRVSGRVVDMPFQEGDLVRTGQKMATIELQPYADEVKQAAATVENAKVTLQNAERIYKRRQELIGDGSVSKEDLEDAMTTHQTATANLKQAEASHGVALKNLYDTEVYAPSDGTILTRVREPGSVVREGDSVYTLSILSPVWIRAFVSEQDLGRIYPGMPAEVFTDSRKGFAYKGKIGFISPVAEFTPKTVETTQLRTDLVYRLRIYVDNPDWGLLQGMPVTVKLPLDQHMTKVQRE
jgi:HlyD family secretion protein